MQDVQKVLEALNIGRIDFKSDQDEDVRKHTHNRKIDMELVKATSAQEEVLEQLRDVIRPILKKAVSTGTLGQASVMMSRFMEGSSKEIPAAYTVQIAQNESRASGGNPAQKNWAYNNLCMAYYIARIAEQLTKYSSPQNAMDYMVQNDHKAFVASLYNDNNPQAPVMRNVKDMLSSMAGNGAHHSPKMVRLEQIIRKHFAKNDPNTRVIVFTSFRDSVHDIVRALREVTVGGRIDAVGEPKKKAENGQKSLTDMFKIANVGEDNKKPANSNPNHTESRIKVAEFIGQGDTTRGGGGAKGAAGAGHARGTRGQTQQQQRDVLDAFRNGTLNTLVATSIGEEGLDIPSVDLIVFFDVVDTIRTIQRMGRTGRARDGKVVVLAQEGREAEKFRREQSSYDVLMRALCEPERVFKHCNDCPRMLPAGLNPTCDLRVLGPTPAELAAKNAPKSSGKKRKGTAGCSFSVRPWDAPLSHVETSLLFTYKHPPDAARHLDLSASAPLQRRPTAVCHVRHGALSVALMRATCAAQDLPPPRDVEGTIIASGAIAAGLERAARDAAEEERARSARLVAGDEDGEMEVVDHAQDRLPDEAFYAPPLDEYGDGWDANARDGFDEDELGPMGGEYIEPAPSPPPAPVEELVDANGSNGGYGWTGGKQQSVHTAARATSRRSLETQQTHRHAETRSSTQQWRQQTQQTQQQQQTQQRRSRRSRRSSSSSRRSRRSSSSSRRSRRSSSIGCIRRRRFSPRRRQPGGGCGSASRSDANRRRRSRPLGGRRRHIRVRLLATTPRKTRPWRRRSDPWRMSTRRPSTTSRSISNRRSSSRRPGGAAGASPRRGPRARCPRLLPGRRRPPAQRSGTHRAFGPPRREEEEAAEEEEEGAEEEEAAGGARLWATTRRVGDGAARAVFFFFLGGDTGGWGGRRRVGRRGRMGRHAR